MLSSAEEDLRSAGSCSGNTWTWWAGSCPAGKREEGALFIATGGNIEAIASIPTVRAEPHPDYPDTVRLKAGNLRRLMRKSPDVAEKQDGAFRAAEDRADVILPACFVYHRIAELNGSEEILVPG